MVASEPWYQEVHFDSPEAFLDFLEGKERDEQDQHASVPPTVFRGQRDASWSLVPRALRSSFNWGAHSVSAFTVKYEERPALGADPKLVYDQTVTELGHWLYSEARAVMEFLGVADTLGLLPHINFTDLEATLKGYAKRVFAPYPGPEECGRFPPHSALESFALAQHYGVPTRLLDWTESPLVAAFFAAFDAWSYRAVYDEHRVDESHGQVTPRPADRAAEGFIAVFAIRAYSLSLAGDQSRATKGFTEFFRTSRSTNDFIRAQRGVFLNMPLVNDHYRLKGVWPTLNEYLGRFYGDKDAARKPVLFKAVIHAKHCSEILMRLSMRGVTPSTIFPTLENAAKHSWYQRVIKYAR